MHTDPIFRVTDSQLALLEYTMHHSSQPELRQRAMAIRLLHMDYSINDTARLFALPPATIRQWRRRWRQGGLAALSDEPSLDDPQFPILERLRALQEISLELTRQTSFDDLCRQAVELGRARLRFDRLGLFFLADEPGYYRHSFGTDENGNTVDEREEFPIQWRGPDELEEVLSTGSNIILRQDQPLFSGSGQTIGWGWNALALLWDGSNLIGFLSADNLIHQRPLQPDDLEILKLYGLALGALCSRRRSEDLLLKERNLLRAILDHTVDYVYVKDLQSRFLVVNQIHITNTYGVSSAQDMLGKTDFDFMSAGQAQSFYDQEQEMFRTGVPILNQEEELIKSDGKQLIFLTTKVPLRDSSGKIIGLVGVGRDITDVKQAEAQRLELALERERIQLMEELVTNISHDLKTPLSIIKTNLYLIERLDDPERKRAKLEIINEQTLRLERLIQDTLMLSRLDQTERVIFRSVNLNALIRQVETDLRLRADARQIQLKLDLPNALPACAGNENDLWRLVANLVENAINYTPAGGTVHIRTQQEGKEIRIEVEDSGIGISADSLDRIFERFYRADKARSLDSGGSGLGLPIVKGVVEMHHGRIEVQSEPGRGSCFRVWLPMDQPH